MSLAQSGASHWKSETLFHDGDRYFGVLLEEIARAEQCVDLETYIFEDDSLGARVVENLRQAARRGVRVRLLVDGVGAPAFDPERVAKLTAEGVLTRVFHPPPWIAPWSGVLKAFQKLNQRDHRKLCLIDRRTAWIGSLNVSARHLREFSGIGAWRDTGVRVEGAELVELERAFERTWLRARGFGLSRKVRIWGRLTLVFPEFRRSLASPRLVRLNSTRSSRRSQYRDLLRRIANAQERVWITNAYFAPDFRLMRAMRLAAGAGADVRLLVPRKSDVFFMPWVTEAHYSRLLRIGVRIYEYLPRFLHAKFLIIDAFAIVGSSNLNHRSLLHDLEADVVLLAPESIESLQSSFLQDSALSAEARIEHWRALPLLRRLIGRLLLTFRYWF